MHPLLEKIRRLQAIEPAYGIDNRQTEPCGAFPARIVVETVEDSLDLPELFRDVFDFYLIQFYKMMDYLVVVNPCFIKPLVERKMMCGAASAYSFHQPNTFVERLMSM